jgi:hypothetical protein
MRPEATIALLLREASVAKTGHAAVVSCSWEMTTFLKRRVTALLGSIGSAREVQGTIAGLQPTDITRLSECGRGF